MTDGENQYNRVCKGEFAKINGKLDRLDEAIRGNGHPGIKVRLDRVEQDSKRQGKLVWLVVGAGITAAASGIAAWIAG
jgi:hypothetical protein